MKKRKRNYTTNTQLLEEIKKIRKEINLGSFDTIHTSFLVLIIGLVFATLLSDNFYPMSQLNFDLLFWTAILFGISFIFQSLSLFWFKPFFKTSSMVVVLLSFSVTVFMLVGFTVSKIIWQAIILFPLYILMALFLIAIIKKSRDF